MNGFYVLLTNRYAHGTKLSEIEYLRVKSEFYYSSLYDYPLRIATDSLNI